MDPIRKSQAERLWTPWRMRYISGHAREDDCIFCNRLAGDSDVDALILHRGEHAFVIMNLFPYNTGHVMIVPNQHAADPEELDDEALAEMAMLLPLLTRTLRRVFACAGFNVGLNIGSVAGAGVAAHLHEHVVPRWEGDANFMPILASTMAIPELIPSTYAKIRAETHRELAGNADATAVILLDNDRNVLIRDGRLPSADLSPNEPVWRSLVQSLPPGIADVEIAGWAGIPRAVPTPNGVPAITFRARRAAKLPASWATVDTLEIATGEDQVTIARALAQLAPALPLPG